MNKKITVTACAARTRLETFSIGAFVVMGLLGSACTVDDLTSREPYTAPSQEPAKGEVPPSNPAGTGEKVSVKIDNEKGGQVELSDGTRIDVPPGALPPDVDTITVTSSTEPAPAEYKTVSPVFVFEPSGTVFLKPLQVTIPISVVQGLDTSKLTILWSRQRADGFDIVPTTFALSSSAVTAVGEVTHFSKGMVGEKYVVDPHPAPDPYAD